MCASTGVCFDASLLGEDERSKAKARNINHLSAVQREPRQERGPQRSHQVAEARNR